MDLSRWARFWEQMTTLITQKEDLMVAVNEIRLKDFYQAVVLLTVGFPLLRLEQGNNGFVTFVFDDPNFEAEETLGLYWNNGVQVDAKHLISNIRELKTRLHSRMEK